MTDVEGEGVENSVWRPIGENKSRAGGERLRRYHPVAPTRSRKTTKRVSNSWTLLRKQTVLISPVERTRVRWALSLTGFDHGFVSRSEGGTNSEFKGDLPAYMPPRNVWKFGWGQFWRNWDTMKGWRGKFDDNSRERKNQTPDSYSQFKGNLGARGRMCIDAPIIVKLSYLALYRFLAVVFGGRCVFARLFLLETVARMPYFSHISMIHLYETLRNHSDLLGSFFFIFSNSLVSPNFPRFWRQSADANIHFVEELSVNDYRHLLFGLCMLCLLSPSLSYEFSKLLETHAVNTYGQFLDKNEDSPLVAVEYYCFWSIWSFLRGIPTRSNV